MTGPGYPLLAFQVLQNEEAISNVEAERIDPPLDDADSFCTLCGAECQCAKYDRADYQEKRSKGE